MAGIVTKFLSISVLFFISSKYNTKALPYPLHASCKIEWNFDFECAAIRNRVMIILEQWTGPDNCINGGEKCLYSVTSSNATEVTAVHETPKRHYKDDIKFQFIDKATRGCIVKGCSRSETWYAIFDKGTNYCNLHNVIVGADLNRDPGYVEFTDRSICTEYETADCDIY